MKKHLLFICLSVALVTFNSVGHAKDSPPKTENISLKKSAVTFEAPATVYVCNQLDLAPIEMLANESVEVNSAVATTVKISEENYALNVCKEVERIRASVNTSTTTTGETSFRNKLHIDPGLIN